MLSAKMFLSVVFLNIFFTSFTYAGAETNNISDFVRMNQALENDDGDKNITVTKLSRKKAISLVCPSGKASDMIFNRADITEEIENPFSSSDDRFNIRSSFKNVTTVFLSCEEGTNKIWYKYVLVRCNKPDKSCISGAIQITETASVRDSTISKDGRLYAKVSVSDTNLLFCPNKKPIKFHALTQRDNLIFEIQPVGTNSVALQFFAIKKKDLLPRLYPMEHKHMKFDVQCGDDPVKELWVEPLRIPGRMLELNEKPL